MWGFIPHAVGEIPTYMIRYGVSMIFYVITYITSPCFGFPNHSATNVYLQIFQSEIVRVLLSKLMPILTRCLPED